ncbi:extracellular solute-binding protein [Domibacillus indicus]|uniref:ABC transporter substrate-binding protein n=1 Tax=Domibacillus indicus TaxID=1437523 RepID=UPI00203BC222|nr:extracellular solute-binding protein [Domibacillus indicus]MCM3790881.1 extracellular solute-binding protein [Domibacillus indicus]
MKRKWLSFFLAALLTFTLSACSAQQAQQQEEESGSTDGKVSLRVVWWGSQERHDATMKVLDLYTEKNPNVTFETEFSGWDGYWDKLATQSAAQNAPDLVQMDAQYLQEYATRNQLADLSEGINVEDMDPTLVDSGKVNDKLYAVALGNNAFGMIYNKAAFEKLGVETPKADWTWDDLFALAREVQPKLKDGKYAMRDFTFDSAVYEMYQLSKGKGHLTTEDGDFNIDKKTWKEWVSIFEDLRKEGVVSPAETTVAEVEYDPKNDLLLNDSVLIKQSFAAQFPSFDSVKPDTYALVKAPKDAEAGGYLKPSMFWSVSESLKQKEEAKKVIDFFINDPEAAEILGVSRGLPVSKKILDSMSSSFTDSDKAQLQLVNDTAPDAQPFNGGPQGWGEFQNNAYRQVGEQLMFGVLSQDEAYEELKNHYEEIKGR